MSLSRASFVPLVLACATLAVLAACGGGGSTTTPPTIDPGPPTPTPVSSGSPKATATPSSGPTATPTPVTTATPSPASTPTPAPTGSPAVSSYTVSAETGASGLVNGTQSWYTSGVTVSWTPNPGKPGQNGDTLAGASAATGFAPMDGMSCLKTQEPAASTATYSTHAFVGIYYNGTEYALPQAIGMKNPTEPIVSGHPNDNYEVETSSCEYNLHTHDYTGLIHIEDVNYPQSTATTSPLPYAPTLQTLLDVWGVQLSASGMTVPGQATLTGPVSIYSGTPNSNRLTVEYTRASSPADVSLGFHRTVWIVIGGFPTFPDGVTGLPRVEWRVQY